MPRPPSASVLIALLLAAAPVHAQRFERDTARSGPVIETTAAPSALACRAACDLDDDCAAWSWVRPGVDSAAPACRLQGAVAVAVTDVCCISGVSRPELPRPRPVSLTPPAAERTAEPAPAPRPAIARATPAPAQPRPAPAEIRDLDFTPGEPEPAESETPPPDEGETADLLAEAPLGESASGGVAPPPAEIRPIDPAQARRSATRRDVAERPLYSVQREYGYTPRPDAGPPDPSVED